MCGVLAHTCVPVSSTETRHTFGCDQHTQVTRPSNHIVDVQEFEELQPLEVELMVGMPGLGDHRPNPNSWGDPRFCVNEDFSSFDALSLYLKFEAKTAFDLTPSAEFNGDIFERSSQQRLVDLDDRLLSELAWS